MESARNRKSPSEDAKPAEFQLIQNSARPDAVRNARPAHLVSHPIQIYHPVFAKFLSRAFLPFDGDTETLQKTSEFINASRRCYRNERDRVLAIESSLSSLVHPSVLSAMRVNTGDGGWFLPDGAIPASCPLVPKQPVCAFVEVKNEAGAGSCDPILQCQSDFVKLCSAKNVGVPPTLDRKFTFTE